MTLTELKQRMADKLNPEEILELFKLTSEDLLEAFDYLVEENFEEYAREYGESEEETEDY